MARTSGEPPRESALRLTNPERLSPVAENYLLSLYVLGEEGLRATAGQLADHLKSLPLGEGLGTTLPSVLGMLRRMAREGLLELTSDKEMKLTPLGTARAEGMVRRHRLAERMVVDLLGLEPYKAHEHAHRLEHAISEELAEKIAERLGHPTTCPFGHPIPGSGFVRDKLTVPLSKVVSGTTVTIDRIPEDDRKLLEYFVANKVMPGVRALVKDAAPYRGVVTLATGAGDVVMSYDVAQRIWVTPVGVPMA